MGCTGTFFMRRGKGCLVLEDRKSSLFLLSFKKIMKFANYLVCFCILLAFAETEWQPALCDSPFKVSLTVILALFWGGESAWIRNSTSQQLWGDSSKALSQQRHRGTEMWLKNQITRQKHKRVWRDVFMDSSEVISKPLYLETCSLSALLSSPTFFQKRLSSAMSEFT